MPRKIFFLVSVAFFCFGPVSTGMAIEKVAFSSSVKVYPGYYLPVVTAEEKGFWKANDLDVEWVAFASSVAQMHAVSAGANSIGSVASLAPIQMAERGLPVTTVAELVPYDPFILWVRSDGPYRHPRDLKGARIGVTRLGATSHAFGRIVAKAYGLEKDVKFAATGGVPETVAAIKVGGVDMVLYPVSVVIGPKVEGLIREIASMADYLPKPWPEHVIFARKDYAKSKPEAVRRVIKAHVQAADFIRKNPRFAMDKIKSFQGISEPAAKTIYDGLGFTVTGRLDRKGIENQRNIFIEYGILTEKTPAVDDLFTNEYVP